MASFTDKISQFNPYIQELPVEAMAQVGMAKQAQYNQGVQKIQSYVDNVAGMSVSRPVEKEYLQSQLDQLGSKLKTVAAGDFSNQQLVNSVGGMAGQIIKDPIIQAAVYSQSNDRSQLAEMDADQKKGKLTPHAKFVYEQQRNAFLNNPNLKSEDGKPVMFTGKYVPSWDLEGAMAKESKLVGEGKYTMDNIFVTDPTTGKIMEDIQVQKDDKGKPIIDPKTGKPRTKNNGPIYSEYAVREIHDGRFPEAVKATINNVLNRPEAQTELGMRGVYEYRGFDSIDDFVAMYEKQKEDGLKMYSQNKLDLQAKLLNEKDPDAKKLIEQMIAKVDNDSAALELTTADQEAAAQGYKSVDAYKAAVYSQQTRNNYMKMFNNATVSRQFIDNVGYKAHQEAIKEAHNWWKSQEEVKVSKRNATVAERNAATAERAEAKKKNENDVVSPTPLEKPATPGAIYSKVMGDANALNDEFDGTKRLLVKQYMALTNPNMSDLEINHKLSQMSAGDPNYIDTQYNVAKNDILKNKDNNQYSHILPLLYQAQDTETKVGNTAAFLKNVDAQAAAKVGNKFIDFGNLQKGLSPLELTTEEEDQGALFASNRGFFQSPTKHKVILSPRDQVNLGIALKANLFKSDAEKALVEQAQKDIETSTGRPWKEIAKGFSNLAIQRGGFSSNPFAEPKPDPYLQKLSNIGTTIHSTGFAETLNAKEEIMKDQTLGNSPVAIQLYPAGADTKTIETIDKNITTVLNKYKDAGINVGKFENYFAPGKDAKGKYSIQVGADRSGSNPQFTLDLYDGKELIQSLPTTHADVNYAAGKNVEVPAGVSDVAQRLYYNSTKPNPTLSTNDLTSNPYNASAYKGAYYTSAQLQVPGAPYLIGGDVFPNYGGGYTPYIYVNQDGEIKAMPVMSGNTTIQFPSVDAAGQLIKSIRSKAMVDEIIKNFKQ